MKLRYVRPGEVLDDGDQVIRGGKLDREILLADARRMFSVYGVYGISVFAVRDVPLDELAQQSPLVRFAELTILRARVLRGAGLRLEATGRNPHHFTVVMDQLEEGVDSLCACKHDTLTNPYYEP